MTAKKRKTEAESLQCFSGAQLIDSKRFEEHRDIAAAVRDRKKKYTLQEAEQALQEYRKGKVK